MALKVFLLIVAGGLAVACVSTAVRSESVFVKRVQRHMGTLVTISAVAPTDALAQAAVAAGFQEIHRLEELWSTWIPSSELSRVNAAAGEKPVKVSPETMALLKKSIDIAKLTGGGFNIAVGPAIEAWSVMEREQILNEAELDALFPLTDLSQVTLNEAAGSVFLARVGMRVDVGGIGKGFAADLAVNVMRSAGAVAGVVALSGDMKTFGRLPGGAPFPFGIQHPRNDGAILAFVDLQDEAISTAGDYERFFERDGVRYHHILDPRTLQPARECRSVTVIAREGITADGLDTGIFVMGPERGMELVERLPDVEAVIVDRDGRVLVSSGLKGRLRLLKEEGHGP
ncbi:MAG: FAD:protein FMN transferase [Nitrospiraceae bacterium]